MKVLVTGSGQLGKSLAPMLDGHAVTLLGRRELDITDRRAAYDAVDRLRPDCVINAAAYTRVDDAESDRDAAFAVNALGPRNLALAASACGAAIVHVSTDYVFDGESDRPYHEFDEPRPLSVYGKSKLAGEREVERNNPRHYIVRTAWLFGPGGSGFLHRMAHLGRAPRIKAVDDQVGSPTYALHLAAAIGQLIETEVFGTYHLAGAGSASWFDLANVFFDALGDKPPIEPVSSATFPQAARRPRYSPLTSLQDPRILLPAWQEGVRAFAATIRESAVSSVAKVES